MKKKKGVIYVRVSTTKDEQKTSLEIQEQALKSICEQKNIELLDRVYHDKSSGTRIRKRKGFIEMLYDAGIDFTIRHDKSTDDFIPSKIRKPQFDYIIVKDIFRFGRNSNEAMVVLQELKKIGVTVYFVNSGVDTLADDYKFRVELLFSIAENESHNTSRRIRFSKRNQAKQGKYSPARLPYGYERVVNKDGETEIAIKEEEAEIVRYIYARYKEDGGHTLSQYLNENNVPTQLGRKWTGDKIHRIVSNEAYYGSPIVQKWTKDDVTDINFKKAAKSRQIQLFDVLPAIVTKEQFDELQIIKKQRTNVSTKKGQNKSKKDIFFEKVYCQECGARFVRHSGDNQKVFYMCQTRRKLSVKGCSCKGIAYNNLVKYVNLVDIENKVPSFFDLIYRQLKEIITTVMNEISEIENEFNQKLEVIDNDIQSITRSFLSANPEMQVALNNMMSELTVKKNELLQQRNNISLKEFNDLLQQLEKRKSTLEQTYQNKEHTFEDKLNFVDKIYVSTSQVEVNIKGMVYVDEMKRFNELAQGTKYSIPIEKGLFKTNPVKTVVFDR